MIVNKSGGSCEKAERYYLNVDFIAYSNGLPSRTNAPASAVPFANAHAYANSPGAKRNPYYYSHPVAQFAKRPSASINSYVYHQRWLGGDG
jgi:hypothetical protein